MFCDNNYQSRRVPIAMGTKAAAVTRNGLGYTLWKRRNCNTHYDRVHVQWGVLGSQSTVPAALPRYATKSHTMFQAMCITTAQDMPTIGVTAPTLHKLRSSGKCAFARYYLCNMGAPCVRSSGAVAQGRLLWPPMRMAETKEMHVYW